MFRNFSNFLGQVQLKKYQSLVDKINALEPQFQALSSDEFPLKTEEFQNRVRNGESLDNLIVEAFALMREASTRILKIRHFDVQLIGGLILHEGKIAEMKTGEGKTFVSMLPAYLNALSGKGVHVVTVNDYLANRDSLLLKPVYEALGLRVGTITQDMPTEVRKQNYECDIVYVTNNELGFDYLRDNLATNVQEIVQSPFNFCIVDEVDSILVDESRTPLIISGPKEISDNKYEIANTLALSLELKTHYEIDEKARNILLTEAGSLYCENNLNVSDLYDPRNAWISFILNALKAKELYILDTHYIVRNDEIIIVDEFTGRIMEGRRWGDGLHQAVEAKEFVQIQAETQTLACITYQNLFLLFPKLSGMTGTAKTEEKEFRSIYNLEVVPVPTNRPIQREDLPDLIYLNQYAKWKAVIKECFEMHKVGRPVLIGTTSIEKTELISNLLDEYNIVHNVLNAKPENSKREAEIVAQAGRKGAVTVATNMAGRGTDIILGGNAEALAKEKLVQLCLPLTIATNAKNEASVNSLFDSIKKQILDANLATEELAELLNSACRKSLSPDAQNQLLKELNALYLEFYGDYLEQAEFDQNEILGLGGLHIIGTERHESRRIDNQLCGRTGRQGDKGSTQFYLSLEDDLLRIFGGDNISNFIKSWQLEEDAPLQSQLLTASLQSAQQKVENFYYDSRKQIFQYDEVLTLQRKAIYSERKRILNANNLQSWMLQYSETTLEDLLFYYSKGNENIINDSFLFDYIESWLGLPYHLKASLNGAENLQALLADQIQVTYDLKEAQLEEIEPGLMRQLERSIILQKIDLGWQDHLNQMNTLKEIVGWRAYGQKDPLVEYKNESYDLFLEMTAKIRQDTIYSLFRSQVLLVF